MRNFSLAIALIMMATVAVAGDESHDGKPGYVDFGELSDAYGEPRVMVNLDGTLLKLVSAMEHSDPMSEEALKNLESVRVHVYNTGGDLDAAEAQMSEVKESLKGMNWEQIVRARDYEEKVDVYVKSGDDSIQGILVMAVDGEEAVFVNVLGDINPEEIASIVDQVNVDVDLDF
ncbi:MAG: DUF4252 domain-containing protein [Pseudomonadota bacterium]